MKGRAPSNEDLMLYADGELDAERVEEVEAYLEQSQHGRDVVATIFELGDLVREKADDLAKEAGADDIASWVMFRIEREESDNVVQLPNAVPERPTQVARPGSIWPLALGGLAAAAAVALMAWRFAGLDLTLPTTTEPVATAASTPDLRLAVASAGVPASEYDPEPSVSVDAIDFGARTGTVFYVPGDTGMTTVVWLSDDEAGDN